MPVRPNVLVIVLDTARADHLPPHPLGRRLAPRLAEEAEAGTALERVYATAPWTLPSHASLLAGAYPTEHGITGRAAVADDHRLASLRAAVEDQGGRWLPEAFRRSGYRTWGLSCNPWVTEPWGFSYGFESLGALGIASLKSPGSNGHKQVKGLRPAIRRPLGRAKRIVEHWRAHEDSGGEDAVRQVGALARTGSEPFFGFVNLMEAHVPYSPPRRFNELSSLANLRAGAISDKRKSFEHTLAYNLGLEDMSHADLETMRALYRSEIRYLDHLVGRILDAIPRERTIVVITADHGEALGEQHTLDHQVTMLDVVLRVPLLVLGPAPSPDGVVSLRQIPGFLADAAGISPETWDDRARVPQGVAVAEYESAWLFARKTQRIASQRRFPDDAVALLRSEMAAVVEGERKLLRVGHEDRVFALEGFDEREVDEPAMARRLAGHLADAQSHRAGVTKGEAYSAEQEAEIEEHLSQLGYL